VTLRVVGGGAAQLDECLLDCGTGLVVSAAFGGPVLTGIRRILLTGIGADVCAPALANFPGRVEILGPAGCPGSVARPGTRVAIDGGVATALGHGTRLAWLVEHTRYGTVLHAAYDEPLDNAAIATIAAARPPVTAVRAVGPSLRGQLAVAGVSIRDLPTGRRVLVTGGSRSGKSAFAEGLMRGEAVVTYVAAGAPVDDDAEWANRVRLHRERRPATWQTVETLAVAAAFDAAGAVLVDGLGTWLAGIVDAVDGWSRPELARATVAEDIDELLAGYEGREGAAVIVTDEVGSGVVPEHASGRLFRDELGRLNAAVAAASTEVWLVTAGIASRLR
jgi:adenosylcobinamide kinase/adenosylcobinamide-phosphate guanylyltransferase